MKEKKQKTIIELFENGTFEEFKEGLNKLDDISPKLKLTFCIEKLKYQKLTYIERNLQSIIDQNRGHV